MSESIHMTYIPERVQETVDTIEVGGPCRLVGREWSSMKLDLSSGLPADPSACIRFTRDRSRPSTTEYGSWKMHLPLTGETYNLDATSSLPSQCPSGPSGGNANVKGLVSKCFDSSCVTPTDPGEMRCARDGCGLLLSLPGQEDIGLISDHSQRGQAPTRSP